MWADHVRYAGALCRPRHGKKSGVEYSVEDKQVNLVIIIADAGLQLLRDVKRVLTRAPRLESQNSQMIRLFCFVAVRRGCLAAAVNGDLVAHANKRSGQSTHGGGGSARLRVMIEEMADMQACHDSTHAQSVDFQKV